jgi:hypothetical protein
VIIRNMQGVIVTELGATPMVLAEPGVLTNPEEVVMRTGDFIEVTYEIEIDLA